MAKTLFEDKSTANYSGFSLVNGGLIYRLTSVFRGKSTGQKGMLRMAIALMFISWVPVCILAIFGGTLNDNDTTISFFEDFSFHVRYLLVLPFLILIELMVNQSFVDYIKTADRLIPDNQQESFNNLVKRLGKLTKSYIPDIVGLIIIYGLIILNWNDLAVFESGRNYITYPGTKTLDAAGWYYMLVCLPIFDLLVFRWLWRWIVWIISVVRIARFKLLTDPLHADQMAGLEFINLVPLTFSFILIAPSLLLSAHIGIEIMYHGATLKQFIFHIASYVFFLPVILYIPLIAFIPFLVRAKGYGTHQFGSLLRVHNRDYAKKWIEGEPPKDEPLLGSMDHSSLADINGSYGPVEGLKLIPLNLRMILLSFVMNIVPYIPLVFTYYSGSELFKQLIERAVGS